MNTVSRDNAKKILVVDDQPWVTEFYLNILTSDETMVLAANTLPSARDIIISFQPDLVVLDSLLGNLDILETIRIIKGASSAIPVFVVTRHNRDWSGSKIARFDGYQIQSDTLKEKGGNLADVLGGQISFPPKEQP